MNSAEARRWRLALADGLLDQLALPEQAEPVLHEMLAANEGDIEALRMLARLYRNAGVGDIPAKDQRGAARWPDHHRRRARRAVAEQTPEGAGRGVASEYSVG